MSVIIERASTAALVVLGSALAAVLGLAACESAANLDVTYGDAGAAAPIDGGPDAVAPPIPASFSGCPCDESAGFGCCVVPGGGSYCTTDTTLCTNVDQGMYLRCAHPDPSTESMCCWHLGTAGTANGAIAAYASGCDGGSPACTANGDCAGTGFDACKITKCNGVDIGACAAAAPPCPQ